MIKLYRQHRKEIVYTQRALPSGADDGKNAGGFHAKAVRRSLYGVVFNYTSNRGGELSMGFGKKVLIGDDSKTLGIVFAKYLNLNGYNAFYRSSDFSVIYNETVKEKPDIVIISVSFPDSHAAGLTLKLKSRFPDIRIIALMYTVSPKLCKEMMESGAERCVIMPVSLSELKLLLIERPDNSHISELERLIADFLIKKGFRTKTSGFRYLSAAIGMCLKSPGYIMNMGELYDYIAKLYETESELVERSLRHLAAAMHKSGADSEIFGERIIGEKEKKLTNAELIAMAADSFAVEYRIFEQSSLDIQINRK